MLQPPEGLIPYRSKLVAKLSSIRGFRYPSAGLSLLKRCNLCISPPYVCVLTHIIFLDRPGAFRSRPPKPSIETDNPRFPQGLSMIR
jgi:hypothetical protein